MAEEAPLKRFKGEGESGRSSSSSGGGEVMKVLFAGEAGCFSENAALKYFAQEGGPFICKGVRSFSSVFTAVAAGDGDYGIVPIENSYSGTLHSVFDCLLKSSLHIVGEMGNVEVHCLVGTGKDKAEVKEVRGHPHILDACSTYLEVLGRRNGVAGEIQRVPALNSASACLELKASASTSVAAPTSVAAIAPREAAERYGLTVLETGIANDANAETRYLIIGRNNVETLVGLNTSGLQEPGALETLYKTTIVLALPNTEGSIFKVVAQFATRSINILKMETRPACTARAVYSTSPRHWVSE